MAERASSSTPRPGAVKVEGGGKKGAGWLKWLLPLLALLILAIVLIALLTGGDDKKAAKTTTAATPTAAASTATATATPAAATTGAAGGTLTSGGTTIATGDGAALTAAVGQRAVGKGLKVVSVARGRGFWVGTSKADRTFVEYGSAVGASENQTYKATVGDVVDFRGPVRPVPAHPGKTLKLKPADAKQLKAEGAYVNASTVTER